MARVAKLHNLLLARHNVVRLLIDLSTMTDCCHHNWWHSIIDDVDNPIVANSQSVAVASAELAVGNARKLNGGEK
jgi:hypothetical protein